jgi:N-acetylglutamate synthase-like GNAT family acetyltransferase
VEFELRISNDPRAIGLVEAFAHETLRHASLSEPGPLQQLIVAAVRQVIDHAYPPGETGAIVMHSRHLADQLEISIRDFGLPEDITQLEASLRDGSARSWIGHLPHCDAADSMHWTGFGPEGKALVITKSFHDAHITEQTDDLLPFVAKPPLAPEQEYTIRPMRPADAVTISQLIYKAYGSSYFNRDVYYPERVAAQNADGSIVSFVAESASGEVVGHYALERNQEGAVAEGGQAVVDPAHRGRRLLDRLKAIAIDHALEIGLAGVWADAVTVHTFTQKANIALGAKPCCVDLGVLPKSETFRGIAAPESPQRLTCLLYFLPLKPRPPRTAFVAPLYREISRGILERLGAPVSFGEPEQPAGHGVLKLQLVSSAATAYLTAMRIGIDTVPAIRKATRDLIEHSHVEAVFVDLPLQDSSSPIAAAMLREAGFSFAGIAPDFLADGDLFRMVRLVDDLSQDAMQIEEPAARELVDFALADRKQAALE